MDANVFKLDTFVKTYSAKKFDIRIWCDYIAGMSSTSSTVRIDPEAHEALKELSSKSGISITRLITLAVAKYVEHVRETGSISLQVYPEPTAKLSVVAEKATGYRSGKSGNEKPKGG